MTKQMTKQFQILAFLWVFLFCEPIILIAQQPDDIIIKVYVHTIRKDNGKKGAPIFDLLGEFTNLRQAYEPHNICFRIEEFTFEDNTKLWKKPGDHSKHFQTNPHNDGVDIYYQKVKSAQAQFDNNGLKAIIIGNDAIKGRDGKTLTHEFGHFFGLLHADANSVASNYIHQYDGSTARTFFSTNNITDIANEILTSTAIQETFDNNRSFTNITIPYVPFLSTAINDVSIAAMNQITTGVNFNVDIGGDLQLIAGQRIVLNPGFTADLGSRFVAEIGSACLPVSTFALKTDESGDSSTDTLATIENILTEENESETRDEEVTARIVGISPNPSSGTFTISLYTENRPSIYIMDV